MSKSKGMKYVKNDARREEKRNAYKVLVIKPESKRLHTKPGRI
jgi:hypothetical protein